MYVYVCICFWLNVLGGAEILAQSLAPTFPPRFDRITSKQGLSSNSATCFLQDKQGFIWIGTHHGLNRYDGYRCKTFFADPANPRALQNDDIMDIAQDRTGAIWVATHQNGVSVLNPRTETFTHFLHNPHDSSSLGGNNAHALALDSAGSVWICLYEAGLDRYNPEHRTFSHLRGVFRGGECGVNPCSLTMIVTARDGALWATSEGGGTYRFMPPALSNASPQTATPQTAATQVTTTISATVQQFVFASTSTLNMKSNFTSALSVCGKRGVWSGSWGGGFSLLDAAKGGFVETFRTPQSPSNLVSKTAPLGLPNNTICCAWGDDDGSVWVGTWGSGLAHYSPERKEWRVFQHNVANTESISSNFITALYRDKRGILWIGTENAGVCVWNPHKPQFYTLRAKPWEKNSDLALRDNMITALAESSFKGSQTASQQDVQHGVWIGTMNAGLHHFDPQHQTVQAFPYNLADKNAVSHHFVEALADDGKGTLWIGNDSGGVSVLKQILKSDTKIAYKHHQTYHPRSWRIRSNNPIQYQETSGLVESIVAEPHKIWLALTGTGLVETPLFRDSAIPHSPSRWKPSIASTRIMAMVRENDGSFWLATDTAGLDKYHPATGAVTHYRYKADDSLSLSSDQVSCVLKSRVSGDVYVGTSLGLNRFNPATQAFTRFTTRNGLPDNGITSMLEDARGNVWIGTNKGLCKVTFGKGREITVRTFNEADGIAGNEHTRAACVTHDGWMYFGTNEGLTIFHPDSIRENPIPTRLVLTGLRKFNRAVQPDTSMAYLSVLPLSYLENIITVEFAALGFTVAENQQYAYKLDGLDKNWIEAGTSREATYTNVRGGDYLFRVRAINADGSWSNEEAHLQIAVTPPFWETSWFLALAAVVVIGGASAGAAFVARQRLARRVQELEREKAIHAERERERERISADIHDEVGSGLTHIAILSEVIKQQMPAEAPTRSYVDTIAATAQETVRSIGNIVWALNPEHDELATFLAYTREYSSTLLRSAGITYTIAFPEEIPLYRLKPLLRRNIFLIIKESLNNTLKHADAKHVELRVSISIEQEPHNTSSQAMCTVLVRDNGRGMKSQDGRRFGNGMKTMRRRAEEIGGTFAFESAFEQGTSVTVRFAIGGEQKTQGMKD
jgi:signal transduction histidine kinase/ligand-binding sensor domain-containing protein